MMVWKCILLFQLFYLVRSRFDAVKVKCHSWWQCRRHLLAPKDLARSKREWPLGWIQVSILAKIFINLPGKRSFQFWGGRDLIEVLIKKSGNFPKLFNDTSDLGVSTLSLLRKKNIASLFIQGLGEMHPQANWKHYWIEIHWRHSEAEQLISSTKSFISYWQRCYSKSPGFLHQLHCTILLSKLAFWKIDDSSLNRTRKISKQTSLGQSL